MLTGGSTDKRELEVRLDVLEGALAMRQERGGLVSVWAYHRVVHPYEHLSAFFNVTTLMGIGAGSLLPPRNLREAVGPMIVTTTADYARVGGHESVRGDVLEDLKLGRRYAELGLPVAVLGGGRDVTFRMYGEGVPSLVRGCSRNLGRGTFILSPIRILAIVAWLTCAYGAFRWAGGLTTWPAFALTAMFAVQMGVLFRQVGALMGGRVALPGASPVLHAPVPSGFSACGYPAAFTGEAEACGSWTSSDAAACAIRSGTRDNHAKMMPSFDPILAFDICWSRTHP
jgi:hypothetical protein